MTCVYLYIKIMLKLHLCDWSNSFSLDAVGNAGELVCEETKTSREYKVTCMSNWFELTSGHNQNDVA